MCIRDRVESEQHGSSQTAKVCTEMISFVVQQDFTSFSGFKGNARVIIPGLTACIECTLDLYPPQVRIGF